MLSIVVKYCVKTARTLEGELEKASRIQVLCRLYHYSQLSTIYSSGSTCIQCRGTPRILALDCGLALRSDACAKGGRGQVPWDHARQSR